MDVQSISPTARAQFEAYREQLAARGLYAESEAPALLRLVKLEEEADRLTGVIADKGSVFQDEEGTTLRAPELLALLNLQKIIAETRKQLFHGNYYLKQEKSGGDYFHAPGGNDPLLDLMNPR